MRARGWRVLGLAALAVLLGAASPATLAGRAKVVDGDTLTVGGVQVRLWGIDAPEGRQTCQDAARRAYACGAAASARLRALVGGGDVRCQVRDHDQYGRAVSQCRVGAQDLGGVLVSEGLAVAYRRFDDGVYAAAEAQARRARLGLWAGRFTPPADWRLAERGAIAAGPQAPSTGGCVFKGNINAAGRRIVHAPGQRDYDATRIDPARGERWFCSLLAAQAAGWTPAAR
jgi:endonuclease YncB( thermonuclease family)